jgi:methyltransferase (TIGR00027 family)
MVVRTRHIDAALEASLTRGVEQVVILGAGLDSRAYRMRDQYSTVRFFEVDSPATQQKKKERVEQLFGSLPSQVVYVPVDFETQSLEERLAEAGFSAEEPSFFVWEGVTMYLNAEAVDATLAFMAENSPAGSEIVFDYVYAGVIDGTYGEPPAARSRRLKRMEASGEPWLFGIPQGRTAEFIEQRGLELVSDFPVGELFETYLGPEVAPSVAGQDRGLGMAVARVGQ